MPVAGWLMLKRGCELGATYFHAFPYTGDKSKEDVRIAVRRCATEWTGKKPIVDVLISRV